jgi:predicted Mrr-cat superfamily restriction endonuclease
MRSTSATNVTVWGIHGRRPWFEMVRDGAIALERPGIGDLQAVGYDRATVQRRLREAYPDEKEGTIRAWTTVLLRFAFEPQLGDLVIHPDPRTRTISVGRITGRYEFESEPRELHRRAAQWLLTDIPRDELSADARQDISRRPAFFEVKIAGDEIRALVVRR